MTWTTGRCELSRRNVEISCFLILRLCKLYAVKFYLLRFFLFYTAKLKVKRKLKRNICKQKTWMVNFVKYLIKYAFNNIFFYRIFRRRSQSLGDCCRHKSIAKHSQEKATIVNEYYRRRFIVREFTFDAETAEQVGCRRMSSQHKQIPLPACR